MAFYVLLYKQNSHPGEKVHLLRKYVGEGMFFTYIKCFISNKFLILSAQTRCINF